MKKLLILGIAATVLNVLVVWVLTHFLIVRFEAPTKRPKIIDDESLGLGSVDLLRRLTWDESLTMNKWMLQADWGYT
jgi:hypothetical protein